jgi:hypothetical protein
MIKEVKSTRTTINTVLTATSNETPIQDQLAHISQWGTLVPRVIAMGPHRPHGMNGLKWTATNPKTPISHLLGTYIMEIPGVEVCLLATQTFDLGGDLKGLLDYVGRQRMELAWAGYLNNRKGDPVGFLISASVVAHMINDIPQNVTLESSAWTYSVHSWLKAHMQPHRYFDATPFALAVEPDPILNVYDLTPTKPDELREPSPSIKPEIKGGKKGNRAFVGRGKAAPAGA